MSAYDVAKYVAIAFAVIIGMRLLLAGLVLSGAFAVAALSQRRRR